MVLYKYLSTDVMKMVLKNKSVRFSQLDVLNDPFETSPVFDFGFLTDNQLPLGNHWTQEDVDEMLESNSWCGFFSSEDVFFTYQKIYKRFPKLVLEACRLRENGSTKSEIEKIIGREILNVINSKVAVFSVSDCWNSLLLWAHYACEHRGGVIGFDEKTVFLSKDGEGLHLLPRQVIYPSERSVLDVADQRLHEKFLLEKPYDWKYEKEYRFIEAQDGLVKSCSECPKGSPVLVKPINPMSIMEIYLGERTAREEMDALCELAVDVNSEVSIYIASVSSRSYDLERKLVHR